MKSLIYFTLLLFGVTILFTRASFAQKLLIPITVKNGDYTLITRIGFHHDATYCIDGQIDSGFIEWELPINPITIFDARFVDHRSVGYCLGVGISNHIQELWKLDTFRLRFTPGYVGYPIVLSWPAGLVTLFEYLRIGVPGAFPDPVDMLTDTTLEVSNPGISILDIVGKARLRDSWGTVSPGLVYTVTPGGFKEPPGPGEGAGVVVDPFGFTVTGTPGADVTIHLTLPDDFAPEDSTAVLSLSSWTYGWRHDNSGLPWQDAGPLVGDSVRVTIGGAGVAELYLGAMVTVPLDALPRTFTAQVVASYAGSQSAAPPAAFDTVVTRTLESFEIINSVESDELIREFRLHPNFPNPFNPSTTIAYEIPVTADVRLSVFNVVGQEVAVLVNDMQVSGHHSVSFDAGTLPSGVYSHLITAGMFTRMGRMILLR